MKKALILIDIQNDYFEGGRNELVNSEQAAIQAKKILQYFRDCKLPVFHVQHISQKPDAKFFIQDTDGINFYHACRPLEHEEVIIKHRPNSFLNTELEQKLDEKGIDTLVICGMMTHMCVDTTVRAANNFGYAVELIEDACATKNLEWKNIFVSAQQIQIAYMAALDGTFAKVYQSDSWLDLNAERVTIV